MATVSPQIALADEIGSNDGDLAMPANTIH
jgi:hypothetical protein